MIKECFEKYTNAQLTELIRSAMSQGCIKPCHVYDAVDILLDRLADKPLRNCDIGTAEEQLKRFKDFCRIISKDETCDGCPLLPQCSTLEHCTLQWAQMPYEEGGAE